MLTGVIVYGLFVYCYGHYCHRFGVVVVNGFVIGYGLLLVCA